MHTVTKFAATSVASTFAAFLLCGSALAQTTGPTSAPPASAPVAETQAVVAAPSAAPPAGETPPAVAFSRRYVAAAAAFETYTGRAATLKADFKDAEAVATALRAASAYEPKQLQTGEIAFAAIVALQDPAFVEGARRLAQDPRAAQLLLDDPTAAAGIPGAKAAAARVGAALRERGARVLAVGQAVKQSAYDLQHQPWSLAAVAEPAKILAHAKALSAMQFEPEADDTVRLIKIASAAPAATDDGAALAMPIVQRGLALAALAVLGQAGDGAEDRIAPMLVEAKGADCMRMSKLNLYQCLAVAGPQYEDVFCLGQHALIDTGQCVMASATPRAAPRPVQIASRVSLAQSAVPTGGAMLIPVAQVTRVAPQP